jgi:hypothetical protein
MAVLMKPLRYALKYATNPLLFVCLANQHAACGEVVGNLLVFSLAGEKGGRHEGHIIQPRLSHGFWGSHKMVGKS